MNEISAPTLVDRVAPAPDTSRGRFRMQLMTLGAALVILVVVLFMGMRVQDARLLSIIYSGLFVCYLVFMYVENRRLFSPVLSENVRLERMMASWADELLHANEELAKREKDNKALLDALPDAIWRTDDGGRFVDALPANDEAIIANDGWKGRSIGDLLPPHIATKFVDLSRAALLSNEPQILDFVLSRNDRLRHYECRIVVCGASELLTVVRDVTQLKQAVAESQVILETVQGVSTTSNLRELLDHIYYSISRFLYAENFFVALFNNKTESLDMEFFVDKYDVVPAKVDLAKGLTGYAYRIAEPMLLTGASIDDLIAEGEIELMGHAPAVWLAVPLRTPRGVIGILVVQHYDDPTVYGQHDLELLTSVGDQIGVAIERKRNEEAVQNSRDYLDRIINSVGDPIYVKGREHKFTLVNDAMSQFIGRTKQELIGRSDHDLFPAAEADNVWQRDELVFKTRREVVTEERFTDALGGVHVIVTRKRLYVNKDGEEFIVGVINDITERKSLEDKLQRAQKLESIGQLAAGIAHEINTPTQYVGDNVRFLNESFRDYTMVLDKASDLAERCRASNLMPDEIRDLSDAIALADTDYLGKEVPKAIAQALDGVTRISKIVQSMKDFAHPGSREMQMTDINKAIESTVTVASNEWKYIAEIVADYDPALPLVPCLSSEFNQVILNMIVNAAHAIADSADEHETEKGTIAIATRAVGNEVQIRISDTGCGMSDDVISRIFDPFFTTKEVGRGTGQGLAISHTVIVDKHNGTIDVQSEPGRGSTFVVTLPIEPAFQTSA